MVKKVHTLKQVVKPTKMAYLIKKFEEFCKRTDLHGFKYIVMEDLNVVERSCWAIAVFFSIVFAIYFVITAYRWYARNPIVTVIESTQGAIWDVPFPAVTICSLNVISLRAAKALTSNLTLPANITAEFVFKVLKMAPHILYTARASQADIKDLSLLQDVLDVNSISMESLFRELSPTSSCDSLVQRCMWKNTMYRCEQLFQPIFTILGLCCTFNYYAVDVNVNRDNLELLHMPTPRRVASCGYQTALTVLLNTDGDDYYSASSASQGSLVLIDNAYNVPDLDSPVRVINPSSEVLIALSPEGTYSTPGIKSFTPEQRQCYYKDETKIAIFKQYSFHNCMAYQRIELIRKVCDCVPFNFPLKGQFRICNFNDLDCIDKLGERLSQEDVEVAPSPIQCLPECEHFDYPLEVALGELSTEVPINGLPFFENVDLENRSVLNVFFNDLVSTRYRRDVYLNWQNILAAFGGLLSLMLGFTLISGFDFIIFFSFRILYDCIIGEVTNKVSDPSKTINVEEKRNWQSNKSYTNKSFEKWTRDIKY